MEAVETIFPVVRKMEEVEVVSIPEMKVVVVEVEHISAELSPRVKEAVMVVEWWLMVAVAAEESKSPFSIWGTVEVVGSRFPAKEAVAVEAAVVVRSPSSGKPEWMMVPRTICRCNHSWRYRPTEPAGRGSARDRGRCRRSDCRSCSSE